MQVIAFEDDHAAVLAVASQTRFSAKKEPANQIVEALRCRTRGGAKILGPPPRRESRRVISLLPAHDPNRPRPSGPGVTAQAGTDPDRAGAILDHVATTWDAGVRNPCQKPIPHPRLKVSDSHLAAQAGSGVPETG